MRQPGPDRIPRALCAIFLIAYTGTANAEISGAGGFESPPDVQAADYLSPRLLQSDHHRVDNTVGVDNHFLKFTLHSEFGSMAAGSIEMLKLRVHEITTVANILNQLRHTDREAYQELRGQLHVSGDSVGSIIGRPFETASELASDLASDVGTASRLAAGVATDIESTIADKHGRPRPTAGPGAYDYIHASYKRAIASQLALDVYSSNPAVQNLLDQLAQRRSRGQPTVHFGPMTGMSRPADAFAMPALEARISSKVKNMSQVELQHFNERLLGETGIDRALSDRFIDSNVYSPTHQTTIAVYLSSLSRLDDGDAFIRAALEAGSEEDAMFYTSMLRMMRYYNDRNYPLQGIRSIEGMPVAITRMNALLVMLPVDINYWTGNANQAFTRIAQAANSSGYSQHIVISTGGFTEVMQGALARLGYMVRDVRY